jgi:hypothetical protein
VGNAVGSSMICWWFFPFDTLKKRLISGWMSVAHSELMERIGSGKEAGAPSPCPDHWCTESRTRLHPLKLHGQNRRTYSAAGCQLVFLFHLLRSPILTPPPSYV